MAKMSLKNLMLSVLSVSLVVGVVLTGGCVQTKITQNITPQEAFALIQNNQDNPDFIILDVRTPQEFADGHIENAINIDFYSETFRDELNQLDKNKTYLIYCRSGVRSGKTHDIMAELEFQKVYNTLGGILAWNADGLPTVK